MRCAAAGARCSGLLGIPVLGVTLVVAAIFVIALYSHAANRRGAIALSDDLLDTLDAQIAQRVAAFLDPCERALRIMREVARGRAADPAARLRRAPPPPSRGCRRSRPSMSATAPATS